MVNAGNAMTSMVNAPLSAAISITGSLSPSTRASLAVV